MRTWIFAGVLLAAIAQSAAASDPVDAVAGGKAKWTAEDAAKLKAAGKRVPAYMTEQWAPAKKVLVWAKPGVTGDLADTKNWLLNGKPLTSITFGAGKNDRAAFDLETDIYLPPSDKPYTVTYRDRGRGGLNARHVTIGDGATLHPSILHVAGNLWAHPKGKVHVRYGLALQGDKNTFFCNDKPPFTVEKSNSLTGGYGTMRYVNGVGYEVSQYFTVSKARGASAEFLGCMRTSDDFQMPSGITIVAPEAQLMPGTRSTQHIGKDAILRLFGGSRFNKCENAPWYDSDLVVEGRIEAGTKEHPLTENAYLGISFKDRSAYAERGVPTKSAKPGLVLKPGAQVVVHTTDPAKAHLVIHWHGRENTWYRSRLKKESGKDYMAYPRKLDIMILGDLKLHAVEFDDIFAHGVYLKNPAIRSQWTDIYYGKNNGAKPDELYTSVPPKGVDMKRYK